MRKRLSLRFMVPAITVVIAAMTIFGWITTRVVNAEVRERANRELEGQTDRLLDNLRSVDELSLARVQSAMKVLISEGERLGPASVSGQARAGDVDVPALRFNNSSQVGNFVLVDRIHDLTDATATLFVKRDESYVRISTNVMKADGSRAVGTVLDPKGKAYAAIREGKAFYGVVDILGKPYMTGYEPMRTKSGEVLGIWYVGYPLAALGELGAQLAGIKILNHGFVALLRPDGKVLFKPESVSEERVQKIAQAGGDWNVMTKPFEKWGYTLVAAYPQTDVTEKLHHLQRLIALCAALMAGLLLSVQYWVLTRLVLRPIRGLVTRMEEANLNTILREEREDEIGELATAFDQFIAGIRGVLIQILRSSEQLAAASDELSASAREQARAADEQSAQTEQVATAMAEMSQTVAQISGNSEQAAEAAQHAAETARRGGEVVVSSVTKMRDIAASVSASSAKVEELGKRSDQIGRIIGVIDDIADQTNLLALNAAIEAARAGEQGRGFAVVADEVRKLAERTSGATKEIGEMIRNIQQETGNAVSAMKEGTVKVEDGVSTAAEAGDSLQQILVVANKVGEMIMQIATATTEQSSTTEHVKSTLGEIARLIKASAQGAAQSSRACQNLSQLVLDLRKLEEGFKLDTAAHKALPPAEVAGVRARVHAAGG